MHVVNIENKSSIGWFVRSHNVSFENKSTLYFLDDSCIKTACVQNLTDFTAFIAHVRQFVFSRSETDCGDAQADRRYGVGAEIPEIILAGFVPKVFLICCNASLSKFVMQVDLPGAVRRLICEMQPGLSISGQ